MTARSAPRTPAPLLSLRAMARGFGAAAAAIGSLALAPGLASAGSIELQSSFAGPIATTNPLCTAEPRGLVYGTTNFNIAQPLTHRSHGYPGVTYYEAANAPSYLDLLPSTQAGAASDLCAGFTLPPNVEPQLERNWVNDAPRLQDSPAWPDLPDTHVVSYPSGASTHGDDLRNLAMALPAGYSLDFAAATPCADAAFGASTYATPTCPASTQLGEAFVRASAFAAGVANHATLTGLALWNLTPDQGEVGRLGVSIKAAGPLAPAKWVLSVRLAGDGSGRLVVAIADAARLTYDTAAIAKVGDAWNGNGSDLLGTGDPRIGQPQPGSVARPLYVEGLSLRLWGAKANHATLASDFGAQASECSAPLAASLSADTYAGHPSTTVTPSFSLADCGSLPLPATATATLTAQTAAAATGATFSVALPQSGARLPAQPAGLELALPAGLEIGPQLASGDHGQPTCSAEQFGAAAVASGCPEAAAIGSATLAGRGLGDFAGPVYLGAPSAGGSDLATLRADLAQSGSSPARLKLNGALRITEAGQVIVAFDELPRLRMTAIELTLRGGDHAVLTAPRACGTHAGSATLTRTVGEATSAPFSVEVAGGCDPAAPQLEAAPATTRSGGRTATSVTLTRPAGSAALDHVAIKLPPGTLVAPNAVPECGSADAAAGTCPAAAQLGSVTLQAGGGEAPLQVTGDVFLTAAPDGAFAGASIAAAVRLGDLELGSLIAPASFTLDPFGRGLTLSTTLPRRVGGVALDLRRLTFDFDRDGVVRQPTGCGPLATSAVVTAGGVDATPTTSVAYPGCGALDFAPAFAATTSGETAVGAHPKLQLTITPRTSDSGLRSAALSFPPTLALDVSGVAPCDLAVFEVASCSTAAKVGVAGGKVAIAGDFLGGDAFLLRVPGASAPGIGIRFGGTFRHRVVGRFGTGEGGATVLTFDDLPDLPLSRWAIQLEGGKTGIVTAVSPAAGCTASTQWTAELTAHNGARARRGAAVTCGAGTTTAGESPVVALSVSAKTGIKLKLTKFGAQQLQAVKLTMPKTIRINAPKAKRRGRTSIALIGAKATPAFTKGSLTLTTYGGAPSEVVARLRTSAYTIGGRPPALAAGKLKGKKRTVAFRLRLAYRDGTAKERSVSVRLP